MGGYAHILLVIQDYSEVTKVSLKSLAEILLLYKVTALL